MNTDDLREKYGKSVSFNCEKGDEAFTDSYVMWLEKQLLIQRVSQQRELLVCKECNGRIDELDAWCKHCGEVIY